MNTYWLCFRLQRDATFGQGEGLAGIADQEIAHDALGLPYLHGRTLKGLLNEECANILYALERQPPVPSTILEAAQRLLGGPGSTLESDAQLRIGAARLSAGVRRAIAASNLSPADVLAALSDIRRQTAVDEATGAPDDHTLRAMRVVLRETPFEARLTLSGPHPENDEPLLAACILGLRRAGLSRNRGRGQLQASLHVDQAGRPGRDITREAFARFAQEVGA